MSDPRPLTAISADHDIWVRRSISTALIESGFEVVAEAGNVLDALREASYVRPALVVLTQDSIGLNPLEIVGELRDNDPPAEIILVTHDLSSRSRAIDAGAHDVVAHGDADQLLVLIAEVREILETGERRKSDDRRSGRDRRRQQDWSRVTTQRRSGEERRKGPRRKDEVDATIEGTDLGPVTD